VSPIASEDNWQVASPESVGIDGGKLCALVARFEGRVGVWRGGGRPGMSEPSVPHKDDRSTQLRYPKPR
jgi:hypothetical protein